MAISFIIVVGCLMISPELNGQSIYQSLTYISDLGQQYSPSNPSAQLLTSLYVSTLRECALACNNNPMCQVFDYNAIDGQQCRLFEGDLQLMGHLVPSLMSNGQVGSVQLQSPVFSQYAQPCLNECQESRYLRCSTAMKCECLGHNYWNPSTQMCLPKVTIIGGSCQPGLTMCREDLNYTCSTTTNQCQLPQVFPLSTSTTIANAWTPILMSATNGLEYPMGLAMYENAMGEILVVVDALKNQIVEIINPQTMTPTASLKISTWTGGNELATPLYLAIDSNHNYNLYVSDSLAARILLFYSMQTLDPSPSVVAGISGIGGPGLDRLTAPAGVAIDSHENVYVSDTYNHRIVLWIGNTTTGILIAGTGSIGSDPLSLNYPMGLFLDEQNQRLYVADMNNHRIQAFDLTASPPCEGVTVAGGYGSGIGSHQLNQPADVWVSKTTGMIFIADTANHRIQRWNQNATSGITIAGDPNGISGMIDGKLSSPNGLTISKYETHLYVSDSGNQRIQRFDLL